METFIEKYTLDQFEDTYKNSHDFAKVMKNHKIFMLCLWKKLKDHICKPTNPQIQDSNLCTQLQTSANHSQDPEAPQIFDENTHKEFRAALASKPNQDLEPCPGPSGIGFDDSKDESKRLAKVLSPETNGKGVPSPLKTIFGGQELLPKPNASSERMSLDIIPLYLVMNGKELKGRKEHKSRKKRRRKSKGKNYNQRIVMYF